MKKVYSSPAVELTVLHTEDAILVSSLNIDADKETDQALSGQRPGVWDSENWNGNDAAE